MFACSFKQNKHDLEYKRFCSNFCLRDEKIVSSTQVSGALCLTLGFLLSVSGLPFLVRQCEEGVQKD